MFHCSVSATVTINGNPCSLQQVVTVDNGCNPAAPDYDAEGMVCANDGTPQEAYCSYDLGVNACARCAPGIQGALHSGASACVSTNGRRRIWKPHHFATKLPGRPIAVVCMGGSLSNTGINVAVFCAWCHTTSYGAILRLGQTLLYVPLTYRANANCVDHIWYKSYKFYKKAIPSMY